MYKIKFKFTFLLLFSFLLLFFFLPNNAYSAYPKLVTTLNDAFTKIESWIINISTPAAAVAVGSGNIKKKFSFGDEEKIRTGKKLVKTALFSYVFILAVDLVLSAIESLI